MNEQRNNGRGIFYGVIGVATLVVAIIGATFAYFTASASNNNIIKGNMATVQLSLAVEKVVKVDEVKEGMIPMSNGMVEEAVNNADNDVCVDDNGNAVCQVYKITITNSSSAGQFVDGYVSLRYGSGAPTDFTNYINTAKFVNATKTADITNGVGTTMRWAQVFPGDGKQKAGEGVDDPSTTNGATVGDYSTAGVQVLGADTETMTLTQIGAAAAETGDSASVALQKAQNTANILTGYDDIIGSRTIAGTSYDVVAKNFIRVSNHNWTSDATGKQAYTRSGDASSALVFNHSIVAGGSQSYYIVVWLSETGTNQTAGATVTEGEGTGATTYTNPAALNFFDGNVTFISAQGSEVSATFAGYARVSSQQ